ncbi:transmembrane protein 54b isoform X1 [Tachysurus fulvidraco]|uniref:transmembrane protein 54b isoform X1 n=1 Tax=Tachysurus fulvidraco TaxID=1234273 RepID=UPI000F4E602B|nr:transmembrane protein 54b isoform X1 [Tachysurus fulvidraco]
MDNSGVSCATLQGPKVLMKMGLCMVLVGHLNFLLAALVHGTVLRHIGQNTQTLEYAISNILALTAGLVGILVGILTIVLSRNEKNRVLSWWVCVLSAVGGVLAAASVVGLLVALVWTLINGTKGLLLNCNLPDNMSYFSITYECPFDPTRIYGTTLILWVPLIVMSVVEFVVSGRCCAASISFIRRKTRISCETGSVKTLRAAVPPVLPCHVPPPLRYHGDRELMRPPEQHELLRASRPYSSSRSAQIRAASSQFNRASVNRASFWI